MGVLVAIFVIVQMILAYVLMVVSYRSLKFTIDKNCADLVAKTIPIIFVLYFDYLAQYYFGIQFEMIAEHATDKIIAHLWTRAFYFICFVSLAKVFADPT